MGANTLQKNARCVKAKWGIEMNNPCNRCGLENMEETNRTDSIRYDGTKREGFADVTYKCSECGWTITRLVDLYPDEPI